MFNFPIEFWKVLDTARSFFAQFHSSLNASKEIFQILSKRPMYCCLYYMSKHIDHTRTCFRTSMQNYMRMLRIEFASCEKLQTKNSVFDWNSAEKNSYCLLAVGFLLLCPIFAFWTSVFTSSLRLLAVEAWFIRCWTFAFSLSPISSSIPEYV